MIVLNLLTLDKCGQLVSILSSISIKKTHEIYDMWTQHSEMCEPDFEQAL